MVNIFNCSSKLGIPIADMIIEAIGCKVSPGDCFPQTICPPCLQEVQGFYLLELELRLITIFQSESLRCQEVNTQNIEDDLQNKCVKVEIDDFGDQVKSEPSSSESESESDFSGSDMKLASKLLQAFGDMIKNELTIKPDLRPKTFLIPTIEQKFECFRCRALFVRKDQLYRHIRTHTGKHHNHRKKRLFQCLECSKFFQEKYQLESHFHNHYGEVPYKCALCPKAYTRKRSLIAHIYFHFGERPYKCFQCLKTFSRISNLKRHQSKCFHLKKSFAQEEEPTRDFRSQPGEQLYQLLHCPKLEDQFKQEDELKNIKYEVLEGQGEEELQDIKYDFCGGQGEYLQNINYDFFGGQEDELRDIKYDPNGGQEEGLQNINYNFGGQEEDFQNLRYDPIGGQEEGLQNIRYDFLGRQVKEELFEDESNFSESYTNWNVNSWQEQDIKPILSQNRSIVHYLSSRYYY